MRIIGTLLAVAITAAPLAAHAQVNTAVTSDGSGSVNAGSGYGYGYRFTVNYEMQVTALGWYDVGGDGLAASHEVGIWGVSTVNGSSTGLVTSATVAAGTASPLEGGFRYTTLSSPITLTPGSYIIGGASAGDDFIRAAAGSTSYGPGMTVTQARTTGANEGFAYPRLAAFPNASFDPAFLGPNFQYTGGAPEPGAWAMMIGGFALAGFAARRKQRRLAGTAA